MELGTFKDEIRHGRTVYGSGKKLVQDAQLKLTVDKRAGDKTFADYAKARKANFGEAAEAFISHLAVNERSRHSYLSAYRTHVKPVYGDSTLARVADDRDGVLDLLTVRMKDLSISVRRNARMIITDTCDEAVKAGKSRMTNDPSIPGCAPMPDGRTWIVTFGTERASLLDPGQDGYHDTHNPDTAVAIGIWRNTRERVDCPTCRTMDICPVQGA